MEVPKPPANPIPLTNRVGVIRGTGELVDITESARRGRKRKGKRKVYALLDLETAAALEMSSVEWRVLTQVMRAVNVETNEARILVAEIADTLDMAASNVSRTMKNLQDRRIIFRVARGVYRVNTHLMFRGSNQDWDSATDIEPEPLWRR